MAPNRWTIEALKEYFEALRADDLIAARDAREVLASRLDGFPQLFTTKDEHEGFRDAINRLERTAIPQSVYDLNHKQLEEAVRALEADKLARAEFETFVENYRIEQERAANERVDVATALATATGRAAGKSATFAQIAGAIGFVAVLLTVIVLLATHVVFR